MAGAALLGAGSVAFLFHATTTGVMACLAGLPMLLAGWRLTRQANPTEERVEHVREFASRLFRTLPTGIMLVDSADRILFVNEQAIRLFGRTEAELSGALLPSLADAKAKETDPGLGSVRRFRKADGTLFYVQTSEAPLEELGQAEARPVRIIMLSDITTLVDLQRQMQQSERLRTAASMASQFAHEVLNPVAAISGSAQVLDKLQRQGSASGTRAGVTEADQALLYQCIVNESDRLDGIVNKFLSVAEFSDERLEQLLKLAEADSEQPRAHPTNHPAEPVHSA